MNTPADIAREITELLNEDTPHLFAGEKAAKIRAKVEAMLYAERRSCLTHAVSEFRRWRFSEEDDTRDLCMGGMAAASNIVCKIMGVTCVEIPDEPKNIGSSASDIGG